MKNRKLMMIAIALACLFAVSAVSAADNATSDIAVDQDTADEVVCDDENQVILKADNDVGTFEDLYDEICDAYKTSGELNLTRDYVDDDYYYDEGIHIYKSITINGNGHTINGNNHARIFQITASNVVLKNIIFENGFVYDYDIDPYSGSTYGGGIYWEGANGALSNCSFVKCHARTIMYYDPEPEYEGEPVYFYGEGGAVYWIGNNGNLHDCSFVNCSADSEGGAVLWRGYDGNLYDCSFVNCSADLGGAISWVSNNGNLYDCSFVNCSSKGEGGAIQWQGDKGTLYKCSFVNCQADSDGGGIYFTGRNCSLINPTFENNSANDYYNVYSKYPLNITGMKIFTRPSASDINITYGTSKNWNVTLKDDIYGNFLAGEEIFIELDNVEYASETNSQGKASFAVPNNLSIGSHIATISYKGNSIYNSSSATAMINVKSRGKNGTFSYLVNEIESVDNQLELTMDYSYDNETDSYYEDGIQIHEPIIINGNGHAINGNKQSMAFKITASNVILNNIAFVNFSKGAIQWQGANGTLYNCSFVNCTANDWSGAVDWNGNNGTLYDCSFVNCSSTFGSGAVQMNYYNTLHDCSFVNCSTTWVGGAVHNRGNLYDCSFVNCSARFSGGAVYMEGAEKPLYGCSFVNCSSLEYGGAISWDADWSTGTIYDCIFVNCTAHRDGGALYFTYGINSTLTDCIFVNCSARNSGGAVDWNDYYFDWFTNDDSGIISNCSFVNCSAQYGGALDFISYDGSVVESSFINCHADINGGGIYINGYNCSLINPIFEGNSASEYPDWYSKNPVNVVMSTSLSFSNVNTTYGISKNLTVTLKDLNGKPLVGEQINVVFNNKGYALETGSDGQASLAIPTNLAPKTYIATIKYAGNELYESSTTTANIIVNKAGTIISAPNVNVAYKDPNGELVATIISEHGKPLVVNLNINFNGEDYTVKTDSNGQASIPIGTLKPGTYTATISYKGSGNYKASTATAKVTVTKAGTVISAPNVNVAYKDPNGELVATITNEHGKPLVVSLNVNFNGKDYTVKTDSNGQASLAIGTLSPGKYTATISYKGSSNYKASTATAKVTVTKADTIISAPNVNIAYKDPNGELVSTITNEHGKPLVVTLNVNLNGKNYSVKTDSDGKASIAVGTLSPGKYTATISYKGSSNYNAATATTLVTVTKAGTVISAPNVNIAYKDPNGELVATITNEHGKPLVVSLNVGLNGKTYTVKTDSDGKASIAVGTLSPGTYTATISYKGSSNYKASTTTAKVTVTKAATVISAPDVKIAYKDPSGALVATITNEHGKPLVVTLNINLNGKSYSVKTDSNGQASIPIDTLAAGTYTATISYKGSSNYNAATTTAKVTVTKAATIISAPDVSVKYKDSNGKLVSTITNEHGKPLVVNLNVELNGKTYTVKTDSNGQASVPTADLAPGTYTATISYKGSGNYKATSTTAKITVKR